MLPVPEGEISFVFCKIKGKKSAIQAFIDSGANCCVMAEGVPQREMDACKLQDGPISIDVAVLPLMPLSSSRTVLRVCGGHCGGLHILSRSLSDRVRVGARCGYGS